jgi:hypothetical protein
MGLGWKSAEAGKIFWVGRHTKIYAGIPWRGGWVDNLPENYAIMLLLQ